MNAVRLGLLLLLFLAPGITARAQSSDSLPPEVREGIRKVPRFALLADVHVSALEKAVGNCPEQTTEPDGKIDPRKAVRRELHGLLEIGFLSQKFDEKDPVLKGMIGPDACIERFVLALGKGSPSPSGICFIIGDFQKGVIAPSSRLEMKTVGGREYFLAVPPLTSDGKTDSSGHQNAYARLSVNSLCIGDEAFVRAVLEDTVGTTANEDFIAGFHRVNGFVRVAVRLDEVDGEPPAEFKCLKRLFLGLELENESFRATGFIQSDNDAEAEQALAQLNTLKKELAERLKAAEERILFRESPAQLLARLTPTRNGLEIHFKFGEEILLFSTG